MRPIICVQVQVSYYLRPTVSCWLPQSAAPLSSKFCTCPCTCITTCTCLCICSCTCTAHFPSRGPRLPNFQVRETIKTAVFDISLRLSPLGPLCSSHWDHALCSVHWHHANSDSSQMLTIYDNRAHNWLLEADWQLYWSKCPVFGISWFLYCSVCVFLSSFRFVDW